MAIRSINKLTGAEGLEHMVITLSLSSLTHSKFTRISEVGVTLRALLNAYGEYDNEISQTKDAERIIILRLEQEKTGEVFQKLMDTIEMAKEGRGR